MKANLALRWIVAAAATALACDGGGTDAPPVRPEVVVADFFANAKLSAACSGTLLSANVVLTAAHCADGASGARVTSSNGSTSTVAEVRTYDWLLDKKSLDRSNQNDVALLVLRTPIRLAAYPQISSGAADGHTAYHVGHARLGGGVELTESAPMRVSTKIAADHPVAMFVPKGAPDSGGALLVKRAGKTDVIVGVMAGSGAKSGGGYVARLSAPAVQRWVRDIVVAARGAKTVQPTHAAGLHIQDDPPSGDPPGDPPAPDPVATPDPDPLATSEPPQSTDPANGAATPASDPPATGEPVKDPVVTQQAPSEEAPSPTDSVSVRLKVLFEDGLNRTFDGQVWSSYGDSKDDDEWRAAMADYAPRHTDISIIDMHGCGPGCLTDVPTKAQLEQMAADRKPVLLVACQAGADAPMGSSAKQMAEQNGIDPKQVYTCPGDTSNRDDNSPTCDGRWIDATGAELSPAVRAKYELHNCRFKTDPKTEDIVSQNCSD